MWKRAFKNLKEYGLLKNGPSKICGRQPLKNLKDYGLLKNESSKICGRQHLKNLRGYGLLKLMQTIPLQIF